MGKGDRKTRRGKLFMGSYGVRRRRRKKHAYPARRSSPKDKGKSSGKENQE